MTEWSPLLLKVLLISLPLSLLGLWGTGLMKNTSLNHQRRFISLVMAALLLLPLLVWLGPSPIRITLPPEQIDTDMFISLSYQLVITEPDAVLRNSGPSVLDLALLIWLGGSLLGGLVLVWGIIGVRRHIRRSSPLTREQLDELNTHIHIDCASLPLQRVRLSDALKGPAAAGFFRPLILIPRHLFERMDADERCAVILHEWAHVEQKDGLFSLISLSLTRLYWWNPLVRALNKKRESLQELIGDQRAAQSSGALKYAKALLSLAEKSCRDRSLMGLAAFFGPISLKERIERILNTEDGMKQNRHQKPILVLASLAMALMLAAAGTEFVGTTQALSDESPAKNTQSEPERISADKTPKLIKRVEPKYPTEAKENGVTGQVILVAAIDLEGQVEQAKVISGHPLLNNAAIEAVKQWRYEPYIVNGQPKTVQFTVVITFKLSADTEKGEPAKAQEALRVASIQQPKLIKRVEPTYPQAALDARTQGQVIVEATTDIYGRITSAKHIPKDGQAMTPEYQLLVDSAIEATKQWVYEPYIIDGEPKPVRFTVLLTFKLGESKKEKPADIKAPQPPTQPNERK